MNKFIFVFTLCIFSTLWAFAQAPGFKIANSQSSIEQDCGTTTIDVKGKVDSVYKTPEIILYNYLGLELDSVQAQYTQIEHDLYENSTGSVKPVYDSATVASKLAQLNRAKKQLITLRAKRDSLYAQYTSEYLRFKHVNAFSFGTRKSKAFFDTMYGTSGGGFSLLNNTGIQLGNNTGSIFSELASGNLLAFRVSIGAMVASSASDSTAQAMQEEALQRLISYGGNTVLNIEYPLMYLHSTNNQFNLISRLVGRGSADFPALGSSTSSFAGSAAIGIDVYADAAVTNNSIRFFANFDVDQIWGTQTFQTNLDISNDAFWFGQLTLGLVVAENLKLSFVIRTFSSEAALRNNSVVAGGQVLQNN